MDFLKEQLEIATKKISEQKDNIVLSNLKDFGIELNLEEQKTARFKKIVIEIQGNKETYYYDNGTPNGLRIVTFEIVPNTNPSKLGIEFKVY